MHLNIVSSISYFWHYKPSASYKKEPVYLSRFTHLTIWLCYLDLGVPCSSHPFCFQYVMWRGDFTYQGLCIWSYRLNTVESFIEYYVFGPTLTIMQRISQVEKMFTYFGWLSYFGQLLYHHWVLYVLLFHLEQKVFCGKYLTQTVFILYSAQFSYSSQLFYLGWLV